MEYIKVVWKHESNEYPIVMYSELSTDRYEVRKVECFSDGSSTYAYDKISTGTTVLGDLPVPKLSDIAEDSQFEPMLIEKEDFEKIWFKVVSVQ